VATIVLVLCSSLATEQLGVHALFGAFLAGAIVPRSPRLVTLLVDRLEPMTTTLLLPLFFAVTGLRTSLGSIQDTRMWVYAGLVLVVAIVGKLGGSLIAARGMGVPWPDAMAIGFLLNTRGLVELVILNIGLDLGILTTPIFSIMTLMALITTAMTAPALRAICGRAHAAAPVGGPRSDEPERYDRRVATSGP
jgi:Kef-type K+ transport system membrane component KefB